MLYRKRPVEVEAIQFTGDNLDEITEFVGTTRVSEGVGWPSTTVFFSIDTLEGAMRVSEGDYVIKGVQGEFYPCKPDIFAETYDLVGPLDYREGVTGGTK